MEIDYRYLKAFTETAKNLSFSKAAKELKVAQSAVSRQVKLLEESIGDQLILRSSKKVLLTEKGKQLFENVQRFQTQNNTIFNKTKTLIRIGIVHGLLEHWFIKSIKDIRKKSDYSLDIQMGSSVDLTNDLQAGNLDIAITTLDIQNEIVLSVKLFEEKLVLISKNEIQPKEVHKLPWIVYNDEDFLFLNYKNHSKDIIKVNSITTIIKLVREGLGIAIIPEHLIASNDKIIQHVIKGLNRSNIFLNMPNFKQMPEYLVEIKSLVEKNI